MKKQLLIMALLSGNAGGLLAQEKVLTGQNRLTVSGYAEVYYQYGAHRPTDNTRPAFVYSHNRSNEVSLNLAYIKASYATENSRANVAIAAGTYMNANYTAEPGVLKSIYEANVGFKITQKHNLWIDAGIFPAHLGFESAVGKDNWTLTRSMFADNSPYFETGAKITYTSPSGKWLLSGLVLNGWQRIQLAAGNTTPAFGHQLTFKPNAKLLLNSSSSIGNDKPDSSRRMRYFHNAYAIYQLSDRFGITAGFDIGAEQQQKGSNRYDFWYTPVLIVKYTATNRFSLSARAEYYRDRAGVIIATNTPQAGKLFGYSLNADLSLATGLLWRTEVKRLIGSGNIFRKQDDTFTSGNFSVTTALAISF